MKGETYRGRIVQSSTDVSGIVDESKLVSVHRLIAAEGFEGTALVVRVNPRTPLIQLLQERVVCRLFRRGEGEGEKMGGAKRKRS